MGCNKCGSNSRHDYRTCNGISPEDNSNRETKIPYSKQWKPSFNDSDNLKPRFDKSQAECYKCHQLGHFASECQRTNSDSY